MLLDWQYYRVLMKSCCQSKLVLTMSTEHSIERRHDVEFAPLADCRLPCLLQSHANLDFFNDHAIQRETVTSMRIMPGEYCSKLEQGQR